MSDRDGQSKQYGRPPLRMMIWTAIALAVGLGTLLYWLIMWRGPRYQLVLPKVYDPRGRGAGPRATSRHYLTAGIPDASTPGVFDFEFV